MKLKRKSLFVIEFELDDDGQDIFKQIYDQDQIELIGVFLTEMFSKAGYVPKIDKIKRMTWIYKYNSILLPNIRLVVDWLKSENVMNKIHKSMVRNRHKKTWKIKLSNMIELYVSFEEKPGIVKFITYEEKPGIVKFITYEEKPGIVKFIT